MLPNIKQYFVFKLKSRNKNDLYLTTNSNIIYYYRHLRLLHCDINTQLCNTVFNNSYSNKQDL